MIDRLYFDIRKRSEDFALCIDKTSDSILGYPILYHRVEELSILIPSAQPPYTRFLPIKLFFYASKLTPLLLCCSCSINVCWRGVKKYFVLPLTKFLICLICANWEVALVSFIKCSKRLLEEL